MQILKLLIAAFIYSFLIDIVWLAVIAKNIYAENLGFLLRSTPLWYAAVVVYIALALGVVYFVIPKAEGSYLAALMWGALFGFVCYSVYDFTNYATIANWPYKLVVIDVIWGTVLMAMTSVFTLYISRMI